MNLIVITPFNSLPWLEIGERDLIYEQKTKGGMIGDWSLYSIEVEIESSGIYHYLG